MLASFVSLQVGDVIYSVGLFFGLLIWGWTLMLVGIAISGTVIQFKHGFTFSLGWWALVYPLGCSLIWDR